MKNAVLRYSPVVTKGLNVPKRYKGFVPFCFRLNENTIDKTKKPELYNCEVLLGFLNNEVTSTPLQSTTQVSGNGECNGVIEINN